MLENNLGPDGHDDKEEDAGVDDVERWEDDGGPCTKKEYTPKKESVKEYEEKKE